MWLHLRQYRRFQKMQPRIYHLRMVQIKFASGSILAVNWTIFASKMYEQMTK